MQHTELLEKLHQLVLRGLFVVLDLGVVEVEALHFEDDSRQVLGLVRAFVKLGGAEQRERVRE